MSSRIRKNKSKNIKRLNKKILNESRLLTEIPNCGGDGSYCTGALSCGGDNAFHGCVQGNQCVTETQGSLSDYHMCSASGQPIGGGTTVGLTGTPNKDITTKPTFGKKPMKKLKEGCGCDGAKETSEDTYMAASQLHSISSKAEDMYNKLEKDEVLDDWVESHLAKIDQMMDSVSDSFNHDQSKDMGDMGTGGCPPGHHFCAASNSCRPDNPPQMEPLTLMGTDVVSLDESIKKELHLLSEQTTGVTVTTAWNGTSYGNNTYCLAAGSMGQFGNLSLCPNARYTRSSRCGGPANTQAPFWLVTEIDGNVPQVGDEFCYTQNAATAADCPQVAGGSGMVKIDEVYPQSQGTLNIVHPRQSTPCGNQGGGDWWCDPTGAYVNPNGGNCVQSPNQPQSYFTGPYTSEADCNAQCSAAPTTGCDQSLWGNYSTWVNNFESLPNFNSPNPNQPCQMLCQRNTLWSNQISSGVGPNGQQIGPNWMNMLECKVSVAQSLMNTHNCSSSNAPAC